MAKILVVDDSAVDRRLAGGLLEKRSAKAAAGAKLTAVYANDGKDALEAMARETPDLVLTDLQMPEMNGLELVEAVKARYPSVPVIIMTAHGSEEIARQALHMGAASYVPKKDLAQDLLETVEDVLAVAGAQKEKQQLLNECWSKTESHFLIPNNLGYIAPLIGHVQDNLTRMRLCDANGLIRIAVCLREALSNAILHGNLEVGSELRETDETAYCDLIQQRMEQEPYDDRHVHVVARETSHEAVYIVRDEGPGFDPNSLPDPTDPANLEKVSGRGMLLIRTFMDEVRHNKAGNEITMIKRRDR
jgi:CheY-like chemotaxis protein/anti-sigma regulatory factor (Ser/Thr protein kinase)